MPGGGGQQQASGRRPSPPTWPPQCARSPGSVKTLTTGTRGCWARARSVVNRSVPVFLLEDILKGRGDVDATPAAWVVFTGFSQPCPHPRTPRQPLGRGGHRWGSPGENRGHQPPESAAATGSSALYTQAVFLLTRNLTALQDLNSQPPGKRLRSGYVMWEHSTQQVWGPCAHAGHGLAERALEMQGCGWRGPAKSPCRTWMPSSARLCAATVGSTPSQASAPSAGQNSPNVC